MDILVQEAIFVPDGIKRSVILTDYAVTTRYPGDYEPITEEEYLEALEMADEVYRWVLLSFKRWEQEPD